MSVASAELHAAVGTLWQSAGIDDVFRSYWDPSEKDSFVSLNDTQAAPKQPFPYCVFVISGGDVTTRMTGHVKDEVHQIRDVLLTFTVYAKSVSNYSAKELAALLAQTIMAAFGGHPTETPQSLSITYGEVLLVQYTDDFGTKLGDDEYSWLVNYNLRVDSYFRT